MEDLLFSLFIWPSLLLKKPKLLSAMSLLSLQAIPKVFAIVHFKSHQFSARLEHVQIKSK